jgi:hypothetical protein
LIDFCVKVTISTRCSVFSPESLGITISYRYIAQ